jgi:hypothetical protein
VYRDVVRAAWPTPGTATDFAAESQRLVAAGGAAGA